MRTTHHHWYRSHGVHKLATTNFWLYELSVWLNTLAQSLVSIFIPILLYKAGYSITLIVLYFFIYNALDTPLNFVARAGVRRFGARRMILTGTVSAIAFFITFYFLQKSGVGLAPLFALAFFAAVYDTFYWVAHLYLFMNSDPDAARTGRDTGILYAVRQSALTLGPAVGAGILLFASQTILLGATIFGFVLSLVPLLLMKHPHDKPRDRGLPLRDFFADTTGRRAFLAKASWNIHDSVEGTLFPLFIFTIFGTLQSVAIIPVLLSVTAGFIALFLGTMKRQWRRSIIIGSASVIMLLWLGRFFFPNPLFYYGSILIMGFFAYLILVPLDSEIFEHGKRTDDTLTASTMRNTADMGTNALLYGALLLFLQVFPASFAIALVGLSSLVVIYALMPGRKLAKMP